MFFGWLIRFFAYSIPFLAYIADRHFLRPRLGAAMFIFASVATYGFGLGSVLFVGSPIGDSLTFEYYAVAMLLVAPLWTAFAYLTLWLLHSFLILLVAGFRTAAGTSERRR